MLLETTFVEDTFAALYIKTIIEVAVNHKNGLVANGAGVLLQVQLFPLFFPLFLFFSHQLNILFVFDAQFFKLAFSLLFILNGLNL